jgi:hypothetical protein
MQEGWLTVAAQSRRDDLEALGYLLVYFMRGRLTWQGLKAKRLAKYPLVLEKKQATSASELCAGLPTEFADSMNYMRDLRIFRTISASGRCLPSLSANKGSNTTLCKLYSTHTLVL